MSGKNRDLIENQYKNSSNLNMRIQLHEKFSTNKQDWHLWLFEQYRIPTHSRILELGCGNGVFWVKNSHRIPNDWDITLSDFSIGMLEDAQKNIGKNSSIHYKVVDIQDIPFEDQSFDVVIANHMLYHVPNRNKAFQEVQRILKPDGVFYASTIGKRHMAELKILISSFDPQLQINAFAGADRFGLENGKEQLSEWFSNVNLKKFDDALVITEAQPLIQYVLSTSLAEVLVGEKLDEFVEFIENKLKTEGFIYITKDSGLFEAFY